MTDAESNVAAPNMQGWRIVKLEQKGEEKSRSPGTVMVKSVKNGLIIDLGTAVWDRV